MCVCGCVFTVDLALVRPAFGASVPGRGDSAGPVFVTDTEALTAVSRCRPIIALVFPQSSGSSCFLFFFVLPTASLLSEPVYYASLSVCLKAARSQ